MPELLPNLSFLVVVVKQPNVDCAARERVPQGTVASSVSWWKRQVAARAKKIDNQREQTSLILLLFPAEKPFSSANDNDDGDDDDEFPLVVNGSDKAPTKRKKNAASPDERMSR